MILSCVIYCKRANSELFPPKKYFACFCFERKSHDLEVTNIHKSKKSTPLSPDLYAVKLDVVIESLCKYKICWLVALIPQI